MSNLTNQLVFINVRYVGVKYSKNTKVVKIYNE